VMDCVSLIRQLDNRSFDLDPEATEIIADAAAQYQMLVSDSDSDDDGSLSRQIVQLQQYVGHLHVSRRCAFRSLLYRMNHNRRP
jgi:hypothetical protein